MAVDRYLPHEADAYFERTGRPFVTLTYAQTLDGSIAFARGQSSPISGRDSLKITHQLRSAHDGILVGIGTVLADNPRLTARNGGDSDPQPIILDTNLRFPTEANLYNHPKGVWIATAESPSDSAFPQLKRQGVELICGCRGANGYLDLHHLLPKLGKRGIRSLMVEGGAHVITSFLQAGLANRAILTIAPTFAGGYNAIQTNGQSDWATLPRLKSINTIAAGDDLIVWGDFE